MANDRQRREARAEQMRKEREKAERRQRNVISAAIIGVVVVLVALAGFAIYTVSKDNEASTELVVPNGVNNSGGFAYTAQDAGGEAPKDEPVKVTLTEDFQCPACASFETTTGPVLQDLVKQGEIEIEYRPVSFLNSGTSDYSSRALGAAMCVLDADGASTYKEFANLLYFSQPQEGGPGPDNDELLKSAKDSGYTGPDSCIKKERFGPWVEDASEGIINDDEFPGTPWVKVAGKTVKEPTPDAIAKAVNRAKKTG